MTTEEFKAFLIHYCKDIGVPDCEVEVNLSFGRLVGRIVSPYFDNVEVSSRLERVWDYMKQHLKPEEIQQVILVYVKGVAEQAREEAISAMVKEGGVF